MECRCGFPGLAVGGRLPAGFPRLATAYDIIDVLISCMTFHLNLATFHKTERSLTLLTSGSHDLTSFIRNLAPFILFPNASLAFDQLQISPGCTRLLPELSKPAFRSKKSTTFRLAI